MFQDFLFQRRWAAGRRWLLLAVGISLTGWGALEAPAAKKYYPPGFNPPADSQLDASDPATVIVQPGPKQVIIKTVPARRPKPKDPLIVLVEEHRYYDAMRMVDSRLKKSPGNVDLLLIRGGILRSEGKYAESIRQFQDILESQRSSRAKAGALNGLGWTWYRKALQEKQVGKDAAFQSDIRAAVEAFRQATRLSSGMFYAWAGLGQAELARDDTAAGEAAIRKAMRLSPNNTTVELARAELLLAKDKPAEALPILYGLKKSASHNPDVYLLLARVSLAEDKVDDAIINLKQLLELLPEHTEALRLLSQSYERKMKPQDAEQALEKAINLNPSDERSVAALLKIYEQRDDTERGVLLLKNLIKSRPDNAVYGAALLEHLVKLGRWDDAYADGLSFVEKALSSPDESEADKRILGGSFARVVYRQARGLMDSSEVLSTPAVKALHTFSEQRLQSGLSRGTLADSASWLHDRLNLLLLDPLAKLPPLPANWMPDAANLPVAMEVAFLEGNQAWHAQLMAKVKQSDVRMDTAERLFRIGDYAGASELAQAVLAAQPEHAGARAMVSKVAETRKRMEEQLKSLTMLPRGISEQYWEEAASGALRLGTGNWETHATLAKALEKRHRPELVLIQQQLAAQYAPTEKERSRWMERAEKTARKLKDTDESSFMRLWQRLPLVR